MKTHRQELQTHAAKKGAHQHSPLEPRPQGLPYHGQPLEASLRTQLEPRFGHTFADVRVHADEQADQLTDHFGARAFTVGNDIFFKSGAFTPDLSEGQHLIAHELAHVVQQDRFGMPRDPHGILETSHRSDAPEIEARAAADAVVTGNTVSLSSAPSAVISRDDDDKPGFSAQALPPQLQYGFGLGGGNGNANLGLGGLGLEYRRGLFHGEANLGYGGSAGLNLGIGAPLSPWIMDVNHDMGQASNAINSISNGGGLTGENLSGLGGLGVLGDIAGADKPSPYPFGLGLQFSHSADEDRVMLGAGLNF